MKGKQVTTITPTPDGSHGAALQAAVLGPSGNLRAPTLRFGTTWIVGFHEDLYAAQ